MDGPTTTALQTVAGTGFLYDCMTYIAADLIAAAIVAGLVWIFHRWKMRGIERQLCHALEPTSHSISRDRQIGVPIRNTTNEDIIVRKVVLEIQSPSTPGLHSLGFYYQAQKGDTRQPAAFIAGNLADQARLERSFHVIPAGCEGSWCIPIDPLLAIPTDSKWNCKITIEYTTILNFNRIVTIPASQQWIHDFERFVKDVGSIVSPGISRK
jgi:hypothetical protein